MLGIKQTERQIAYAKKLRQKIMAEFNRKGLLSIRKDLLQGWGFGKSLRNLDVKDLKTVLSICREGQGAERKKGRWQGKLDRQGRYMWSLMKQIGWNFEQIKQLMASKFTIDKWELLSSKEKREIIVILKNYNEKTRR